MYPASAADGGPDDGSDSEAGEHTVYREDAGPLTEQWQQQNQDPWMHGSMAQHEPGVSVLPPSSSGRQTEREWQSSLQAHQNNLHMSQSHDGKDASQGVNAFQPIANLRLPSTLHQNPASAFTGPQRTRQPANTPVDRYQHATALPSPNDFVWQPIRPQAGQHPEQYAPGHHSVVALHAASVADMADRHEPTWMTDMVPPSQLGQHSRSLRESLDAAARLDSRLQLAQQEQQQQQQQQSRWPMQDAQWHLKQGQARAAGKDTVGSSTSWQDLQDPHAAGHLAAPQHAALHKQQPPSSAGAQPQRQATPLIDRSGPQVADPLPAHQAQYHMPPRGVSSADWLASRAAEPDAVLEAGPHGNRQAGGLEGTQLDTWMAEASPVAAGHHSSVQVTGREDQYAAANSANHCDTSGPEPAAGSDPQRPYQVSALHMLTKLLLFHWSGEYPVLLVSLAIYMLLCWL